MVILSLCKFRFLPLQDKGLKFLCRYRLREEIPLHDVAAQDLQRTELFLCLHAFRDDRYGQIIRDPDDHLKHMRVAAFPECIADKLHIQLQHVDRQRRDHIQRRIPRPEIIHLDLESQALQFLYRLNDLL